MCAQQAALDLAGDQAGDDVALLVLGREVLPLLAPLGLAIAQDDGAVLVLGGLEEDLDLVAGAGRDDLVGRIVEPFAQLDGAFTLVTHVDPDLVVGDAADAPGNHPIFTEVLPLGRQPITFLVERLFNFEPHFFIGGLELTEQITVDHREKAPGRSDPPRADRAGLFARTGGCPKEQGSPGRARLVRKKEPRWGPGNDTSPRLPPSGRGDTTHGGRKTAAPRPPRTG